MARPESIHKPVSVKVATSSDVLTLLQLASAVRGLSASQFLLNCALERLEVLSFDIVEGQPPKKLEDMSALERTKAVSFAERIMKEMRGSDKGEPIR